MDGNMTTCDKYTKYNQSSYTHSHFASFTIFMPLQSLPKRPQIMASPSHFENYSDLMF